MRLYSVSKYREEDPEYHGDFSRKYFRVFTGTWQNELDEFCLSSDKNMMAQIAKRENGFLDEYNLVEDEGF